MVNEYFPKDVEIDECLSFEELIDSVVSGKSDQAVMAIENSIAGPIIPNYALIDKNNLHIIGEHYLDIHQNLMVLKVKNGRYSRSAFPSNGVVTMYGISENTSYY